MAKKVFLSHDELMELIAAAQSGNEDARERIVESNTRLVWSVVKKYSNRGYEQDDLFQIGAIGLLKAINKFNMEYAVRFSTYAVPMIQGEIQRFLRDDGIVKYSRSVKELSHRLRREELLDKTPEEIVEILKDVTIDQVKTALEYIRSYVTSMEATVYEGKDGEDVTLGDQMSGDVNGNWAESIELREALDKLEPRDRKVIELRYFLDRTQLEAAEELGVSQVHISRLERKILQKIKLLMEDNTMPVYSVEQKGKAIKLLKETGLTLAEIHEQTTVPLGTLGSWSKKVRPAEVTAKNRVKGYETSVEKNNRRRAERKPVETPVINEPTFMGDKDLAKAERRAKQAEAAQKAFKELKEEKPLKTIGEAAKEYEEEIRKQLRAEIEEEVRKDLTTLSTIAVDMESVPVPVEPIKPSISFTVDVKFGGQHVTKDQAVASLYEAYNLVKRLPTNSLSLAIVVSN